MATNLFSPFYSRSRSWKTTTNNCNTMDTNNSWTLLGKGREPSMNSQRKDQDSCQRSNTKLAQVLMIPSKCSWYLIDTSVQSVLWETESVQVLIVMQYYLLITHFHILSFRRKRKPAFTDRILFRIKDENLHKLIQSNYASHPDYLQSDHKPVSSLFTIKIRKRGEDVTDGEDQIIREPVYVTFDAINFWKINEDSNWIRFRFTDDKGTSNRAIASRIDRSEHWIGVFPANFTSLDQWITYAYADDLGEPTNQMRQGNVPSFSRISFTSTSLNFFCYPQMTDCFKLLVLSQLSMSTTRSMEMRKTSHLDWTSMAKRETHHRWLSFLPHFLSIPSSKSHLHRWQITWCLYYEI